MAEKKKVVKEVQRQIQLDPHNVLSAKAEVDDIKMLKQALDSQEKFFKLKA